ncbi:bifunctional ADP-dependent NAD(P)H-hydrate dehydratase/NAD(P)H-hydrate epimerase [Candidatus Pantoea edessiphila]|uniref:Bifunctional NAD(P)H-hydrate repair enzyme n=1 Tax=Candidatus Pantoea edessiphila TaxID=2044610 RepID=A0A2P5SW32_9GAMM|nr:bifunctional ADP-dependent NAD(P)H-hydrate dehydratase/NAD(P)H-hydrate epimerase [Candidatus Pantoea edessiphila]PPI86520.1 bifunctional ADP-dependent NAD(P)H-hydrate dehydratase/NAD(P)H-hydrate epimerase [Candidatus Pantoea edessiphila]
MKSIKKNKNKDLPDSIWPITSIPKLEKEGADYLGIDLYELMLRAGNAIYQHVCTYWPNAKHWLFLCGHGNNGGDGYIAARIAKITGKTVTLISYKGKKPSSKETQKAYNDWLLVNEKNNLSEDIIWPDKVDIIIDALLGIGINRIPDKEYSNLIQKANVYLAPIISVDVPSGLFASNGCVPGEAIFAYHTLTFITLKPGQITGKARNHIGKLYYADLGFKSFLLNKKAPILRFDASYLSHWLKPRSPTSHKGNHGKLLVIGGYVGVVGATFMVAEAALKTGSGLVKLLTYKANIIPIITARPEIMIDELTDDKLTESLLWADVVVVGPGFGNHTQGIEILKKVLLVNKTTIWDADALNVLAILDNQCHNRIITPHPGEASRLLNVSVTEIENDRLYTVKSLINKYGGIVVLKGPGTIISDTYGNIAIADVGNAGMASGGMGDVLCGIIASLVGQNLTLFDAACAGCVVHGAAADELATNRGPRGILATDLFKNIWKFVNPITIK